MVCDGAIKNSPHGDEDEGANQSTIRRVSDAIVILSLKSALDVVSSESF